MAEDVDFSGETDVFADIQADPLAEEQPPAPAGVPVQEGTLGGDDPQAPPAPPAPPAPGEYLEEPAEAELPTDAEAQAAAAQAAAAQAAAAQAAPAAPAPDPAPPAPPVVDPAPPPPPAPPAQAQEAAPPAPAAEAPAALAAPAAPAQEAAPPPAAAEKKPAKGKAKEGEERPKTRDYIVLYMVAASDDAYKVGPTVNERSVKKALEEGFATLQEQTKQSSFHSMVAVPALNWKPQSVSGEVERVSKIKVG